MSAVRFPSIDRKISGENSIRSSIQSSIKSHESNRSFPSCFPQIKSMEDVIDNFFNQIVQYVIEDMVVIEPNNADLNIPKEKSEDMVKDYKELKPEDLDDADIVAASGSRLILSKRTSEDRRKKKSFSSNLGIIQEEVTKSSSDKTSTSSKGSYFNDAMDDERQVKIIFTNGNIYEGLMLKRIMNGKGKYIWKDGTIYEGYFKDGFPTGHGRMILPDLSFYEGEFNRGLFHGDGFLNIVSTPSFYSGQWQNGKKHGHGWMLYEPGDWYEGNWAYDLKDGFGIRHYKNGAKYRGFWRQGKYEGHGVMIWENNDFYKGSWFNGKMDGKGEYVWNAFYNNSFVFPVQNIYRGLWENGKRNGEGIMLFADESGIKLKGLWDQDFKHGDGLMICGNGRIVDRSSLFHFDKPLENEFSAWSIKNNRFDRIINIPIFTAPEYVDVGFYIDKVLAKLEDVSDEKLEVLKQLEEKYVKHVIIKYLPHLKELYYDYATLAAKTKPSFKPIMIRLFLWHFYKDIEIYKYGISLIETDNILAKNPRSCVDSQHDPFELIYFWQFLMSLIGISLTTANLDETYDIQHKGVSATIITNFFEDCVFSKIRSQRNHLMLNHLDLAPIKSVYKLYLKIGEAHTARTYLRESCTRKGETPLICHLELFSRKNEPKFGTNLAPIAGRIIYEKQNIDENCEVTKRNWTNLYDFRHLGPKNILRCLTKICPLIMKDDLIVDINYPLTFSEFYETLLTCIFMTLELELKREAKILWQTSPTPLVTPVSSVSKNKTEGKKKKGIEEKEKKEIKSAKKKKKKK